MARTERVVPKLGAALQAAGKGKYDPNTGMFTYNETTISNSTTVSVGDEKIIVNAPSAEPDTGFQANRVAVVKGINSYHDPNDSFDEPKDTQINFDEQLKTRQSKFSPLFQVQLWDEIWKDEDFAKIPYERQPTIANLLSESNTAPGLKYEPTDFMYCNGSDYASGEHLITLRRFGTPINDCIMFNDMPQVDVGRLVTYSTEELNKLSDIMSMSFGMNWKELTADFWTPEVIGDERGATGLLGTLYKFTNPNFAKERGVGANGMYINPMHDQNKVYGPIDVITKTHIRDRGLNFNQDINLTFKYDLCAFDGVNPRAAFIDLLSNLLVVTFNDATFWGGANVWRGKKRSYYQNYISVASANSIGTSFTATMEYYKNTVSNLLKNPSGALGAILKIGEIALTGLQGFALDKLCNTLGRPSVVVANSLLNSEPVGMWHLTIGNPFRPIMSIGNLILTDSKLSFSDTLGNDGFPNQITLTCTLKHAKPRSRAEIEMMFNAGKSRTYWQPKSDVLKKALQNSHTYKTGGANVRSLSDVGKQLTNTVYSMLGTQNPLEYVADATGKLKGNANV